jgi:hypothetical protein
MNLRSWLVLALSGCGGATQLDSNTLEGGASVTLTIPLGTYSDCSSAIVTVAPNLEGLSGGNPGGTITLAEDPTGVVAATLTFPPSTSGKVVFTPTSETSATFATGQSFDVEDIHGASAALTATTGALVLVRQTLFVSAHGQTAGGEVGAYFHCAVPATLPPTSIVTNAAPAPLTTGVYGSCTSDVGSPTAGILAGGNGTITVTESAGILSAAWNGFPTVCTNLDFSAASGSTATLAPGQTCTVNQPCGPPPSLGPPSKVPSQATLTNTVGSMTVNGASLFINVVGDTTPQTCGTHYLSVICSLN